MKEFVKKILRYFGIGIKPTFRTAVFGANRLVSYKIGDKDILINRSHVLPFITKAYPECNRNLPRLVKFVQARTPKISVLDIGANVGDTVAFIRAVSDAPIYCIEGNSYYYDLLQKNLKNFSGVTAFKKYLGEKIEDISVNVDTSKGTSSLAGQSDKTEVIKLDTLDHFITEDISDPQNLKIIKIDTDGFDTKILRGGFEHFKAVNPILFFEYDTDMMRETGEDGLSTLAQLETIGYKHILFYDSFGRFLVSLMLENKASIHQLHNYIYKHVAPFDYYDVCLFHSNDSDLAEAFIQAEMQQQIDASAKYVS